jgi:hypothetical protein
MAKNFINDDAEFDESIYAIENGFLTDSELSALISENLRESEIPYMDSYVLNGDCMELMDLIDAQNFGESVDEHSDMAYVQTNPTSDTEVLPVIAQRAANDHRPTDRYQTSEPLLTFAQRHQLKMQIRAYNNSRVEWEVKT